jgi:signal transduction histidine kinase
MIPAFALACKAGSLDAAWRVALDRHARRQDDGRMSIRWRLLIAMNVLIVAMGFAATWVGARVAGEIIERRLLLQVSEDTSRFLASSNLPVSDTLMDRLASMFAVDFVALSDPGGELICTSLPADEREPFLAAVAASPLAGELPYPPHSHYQSTPLTVQDSRAAAVRRMRLYVVAPVTIYADARQQAATAVTRWALIVGAALSSLSILLTLSITRPIRRLVTEMDDIATDVADEATARPRRAGPAELAQLDESFHRLLVRLERAQMELTRQRQLAAMGRMAAGVAHELRNPLSGIAMHLRLLAEETDSPERLDLLQREIQRMDLVIQELLSLATDNDETPMPLQTAPIDLGQVLASVVALLQGKADHAGVALDIRPVEDLPLVAADANGVRQIVMNLLINAIEASGEGGRVALTCHPIQDGVRCEISDTGPGVSAEAGDIFEPFVSTRPKGAGLGLYISRKIIIAHGGQIGYRNEASGGTFWFELPTACPTP